MSVSDLILLHPPSIFRFRELPCFQGPISDVIPSTSLFEGYPIGFLILRPQAAPPLTGKTSPALL